VSAEPLVDLESLQHAAVEARMAGEFARAAELFADAAAATTELPRALHLQMRRAYCLVAAGRRAEALAIAEVVADRARSEGVTAELADALGVLVEHHLDEGRLAEATHVLAEATFALGELPEDPCTYQVVHNMAATYARCGFFVPALELYERSIRLAGDEDDRLFSYASMAAAYHGLAASTPDPATRSRALHDGLYAATAALHPAGSPELLRTGVALAHRAMMLALIGHDLAALADAAEARRITDDRVMRQELAVAMAAEVVARWHSEQDPAVLELIAATYEVAAGSDAERFMRPVLETEVGVLRSLGRFDDAWAVHDRIADGLTARLQRETDARWAHVLLGVEHRRVEALSESDPLTGLANRRFLSRALPAVLEADPPVCVGVIDLDGFKRVNDEYSYLQGDQVLQQVGAMLEKVCRRGDAVVRLGGDEFVMVLREASPGDARAVFERIRAMIAARRWEDLPETVSLTASVGVAVGSGGHDAARVLGDAMEAMRQAKRQGRDRVAFR
jgi:diguanylate cyclase (GGDEF)-like protein